MIIKYGGLFIEGNANTEIIGVEANDGQPTNIGIAEGIEITKEQFYDFKGKNHTEAYFENQELSSLGKSLNSTAHRNMEVGSAELEGGMDFYENLFVYHEQDAILYPYELAIAYRDAMFSTTSYMDERQIEVFNDKLIFGKYLETKTGHSNLLSKFYDLFNPAVTTMVDGVEKTTTTAKVIELKDEFDDDGNPVKITLTLFDKSLYPSLNPAPVKETVAPTSAIKADDEGKKVFKVPVDEAEEVEEENPTA